jgi:hypothetical protein
MSQQLPRFDTAQIGPLRELLKKLSTLKALIAEIVLFRVVVDANYVVQSLIYRVRHPDRGATALEEMVKATVIDVFAPRWLDIEMASAIRQAAAKTQLSEAELWARWLEFRPILKWDDSLREPAPESSECRDPKDHPYVILEKRLEADGILSKDPHIAQMGGHPLTLDFILSARSYARAVVTTVSIRVLGTVLPAVVAMALVDLLRRMGRAFGALPDAVKALLLLGGAVALLHPGSRRWIADRFADACTAMGPAWQGFTQLITMLAATSSEAQYQATVYLQAAASATRRKRSRSLVRPRRTRARVPLRSAPAAIISTQKLDAGARPRALSTLVV